MELYKLSVEFTLNRAIRGSSIALFTAVMTMRLAPCYHVTLGSIGTFMSCNLVVVSEVHMVLDLTLVRALDQVPSFLWPHVFRIHK